MPWGRINEPETKVRSLEEEFGMPVDEVKKRLNNSVPKEDFDALKAQNEEYGSTLTTLQQQLQSLTAPKTQVVEEVDPTTAMISDPLRFVQDATAGDRTLVYQSRADLQEIRARQKYAAVFAEHEKELLETAGKMSLGARAGDGFWDMHVQQILGGHALRGDLKGSYPSLMGGGSGGYMNTGDRESRLEPHMAEHASKRGIKADDLQAAEKLVTSKDKISLENYKKVRAANA